MRSVARAGRSLAAGLVVCLVTGGGIGVEAGDVERPTGDVVAHSAGSKKARPTSAEIENYKVSDHAGEPTMGATPAGTLFYVAFGDSGDGLPFQVRVMASDDGASWTDVSPAVGPQRRHPLSLDPYLYVDRLGEDEARIFTIDLTLACSYLSFTDDQETWTTNPLACGRPVNDHQTLFAGPPATSATVGYPHVVYYCFNDVVTSSCSKSLDGGLTFVPTGVPAFVGYDDALCGGLHGHGVVGPDGTVFLPREYCKRPMLAISTDEGATWETVDVSSMETIPNDPSVAVDAEGNIYYLFIGLDDRLPYLTISRDDGETWSRPVPVGMPGLTETSLATIEAGAPGKIAIAYMGSTNVGIRPGQSPDEPVVRDHLNATWNAYVAVATDLFSKRPKVVTGQVNPGSDPIKRRTCGPGACGQVLDFIDVIVAPDGTPWGAFVDACTDECAAPDGDRDFGEEGFVGHLVGAPPLN
jgi:hypothetical protein